MPRHIDKTPQSLILARASDGARFIVTNLDGQPLCMTQAFYRPTGLVYDLTDPGNSQFHAQGTYEALIYVASNLHQAGVVQFVPDDEGARLNPPLEDALAEIGVAPDVAERVLSETDRAAQGRMVALLRKRPDAGLADLDAASGAVERHRQPTERERIQGITWATDNQGRYDAELADWFAYQLVKHRRPPTSDFSDPVFVAMVAPTGRDDVSMNELAGEIRDWYRDTHPRLASYSWRQAIAASARWHEEQSKKGAGHEYDGSQKTIHTWPDGWKLVQVKSENDYKVEGSLMGHCVASYWGRDESSIFSLRDPTNHPHVTIEAIIEGKGKDKTWNVLQVQGKGDRKPVAAYAKRLHSFFSKRKAFTDVDTWTELWDGRPKNLDDALDPVLDKTLDDHGVAIGIQGGLPDLEDIWEKFNNAWSRDRDFYAPGQGATTTVARIMLEHYDLPRMKKKEGKKRITWADLDAGHPRDSKKGLSDNRTQLRILYDLMSQIDEENRGRWTPYEQMPERDEDESDEDFVRREEKWMDQDGDNYVEWLRDGPYGFLDDVLHVYEAQAKAAGVKDTPKRAKA